MSNLLDVRTLILVITLVMICRAAVIVYVSVVARSYPPIRYWAIGSVLAAAGALLTALRGVVPVPVSIIAGQALLITGWLMIDGGIVIAAERKPPWFAGIALAAVSIVAAAWLILVQPDFGTRTVAVSLPPMLFDAYAAAACLRARTGRRTVTLRLLGVLLLFMTASNLLKTAHVVTANVQQLFIPDWQFMQFFIVTLIYVVVGSLLFVLLANLNVQEQIETSAERIFHQANYDRLTDLANRYRFFDHLANELARAHRTGGRVALLYMDLDRFKPVNDSHGHEAGDIVLKAVAARWRGQLRSNDLLARIGGDEFAVIVSDVGDPQEAGAVANKMIEALAAPFELPNGIRCSVGVTAGIALYPDNARDMHSLVKAADAAMYAAKADGGRSIAYSGHRAAPVGNAEEAPAGV